MSVVEDVEGGGGVVLQAERLQPGVIRCFGRYDVNGRLTGSVGDREVISPFIGSCNDTRGGTLGLLKHHCVSVRSFARLGDGEVVTRGPPPGEG